HIGHYLGVLFRVLPACYEVFADAVEAAWGERIEPANVLRFGTWVGGGMDGNPNVGADTIEAALAAQRGQVLEHYRRELEALAGVLTGTRDGVGSDRAVEDGLACSRQAMPEAASGRRARREDTAYCQLLPLTAARLAATGSVGD